MLNFFKKINGLNCRNPSLFFPIQDIMQGGAENEWIIYGEKPALGISNPLPIPGWNMLEILCDLDVSYGTAWLTLESTRGTYTLDLPLRAGKLSKRLVYIPFGLEHVIFSSLNVEGLLVFNHFSFVWLTPAFAHNRLMQRLSNIHRHYRDLPLKKIKEKLQLQAAAQNSKWTVIGLEDYDSTFVRMTATRHYQKWIRQIEQRRVSSEETAFNVNVKLFKCSVIIACAVQVPFNVEALEKALISSLESLGKQLHSPTQVIVLLSEAQYNALEKRLGECQKNLLHLECLISLAESLAAQREEALSYCKHDWVLFLRPGDHLASNALFHMASIAVDNPKAQMLVADEDSLDEQDIRHSPQFKPEWNADLLLSMPYMGRAVCYQHSFMPRLSAEMCGEFANDADWLDYVQTLTVTRRDEFSPEQLAHVPHIAYHGASGTELTPASYVATVAQHLREAGHNAEVTPGLLPGTQRVRWPMPDPAPLVSLLVPTRDGVHILRPCVDAILDRTHYTYFELLILDNQSSCPETLAYLKDVAARDSRVKVLLWDAPFNYSSINNFGAANAKGSIIGLINNDIEPIDGQWLSEMVEQVSRPEIGCVGAKLYYPNDTVQHGGVILGLGGLAGHAHRFFQRDEDGYMGRLKVTQNLSAVTAACLLLRKDVFDAVNGLNEADLAVAYNDVDLCIKVREAGYRNLWTPYAALYHHESISRGADDTPEKRARWLSEYAYMRKTWGELLDSDPAYNPNLTLVHEDYSLR